MRLSNTEQEKMKLKVWFAYQGVREKLVGWNGYCDFDDHSPCKNIIIFTPKFSEIKVFIPNSTTDDSYSEQWNTINVWIDDNEEMEYFADENVLIDYFLENVENL